MNQAPQFVQAGGANALKITISGSYKKVGDGEVVDFEDIQIIMPRVDEEIAIAAARKRYAYTAIKSVLNKEGEKKYPKPIDHIRNVYIDDMQEIEHDFPYVGKGIKEMTEDDLQNLAVEKSIREIPLPRRQSGISMREMRQRAYQLFAERVLGWEIDMNDPAQNNYSKWNDIIPNPMQKAKPIQQKTAEDAFGDKSKEDEKFVPQHVAPQPTPAATAPHVATSPHVEPQEPPAAPAPAPVPDLSATLSADESDLNKMQKLAKDNDVKYEWDDNSSDIKDKLIEAGVSVS
jgi:hypothetical protein